MSLAEQIQQIVKDIEMLTSKLEALRQGLAGPFGARGGGPDALGDQSGMSSAQLVAEKLTQLARRALSTRFGRGLDPDRRNGQALDRMVALRKSPAGFPMAPSVEEWEALSPAERAAVVAALPGEVTDAEMSMSEGERHFRAKIRALEALRGHFTRQRRRAYFAAELPTYYPAEPRFAPDLFAVLDADDHMRDKWIVSAEGKGLDWVLEVHVGGDRKKDAEYNVERYARLGIPEYFLFDGARNRLSVYRLESPGARVYTPVLPNAGRYPSRVLGLDVRVEDERLRFYVGEALLLESEERIAQLQALYEDVQQRREEETRRREEETRRREEETRRREEMEQELARLRAELERLKS